MLFTPHIGQCYTQTAGAVVARGGADLEDCTRGRREGDGRALWSRPAVGYVETRQDSEETAASQPPHEVAGQKGRGKEKSNARGRMAGKSAEARHNRVDEARRKKEKEKKARKRKEGRKKEKKRRERAPPEGGDRAGKEPRHSGATRHKGRRSPGRQQGNCGKGRVRQATVTTVHPRSTTPQGGAARPPTRSRHRDCSGCRSQ